MGAWGIKQFFVFASDGYVGAWSCGYWLGCLVMAMLMDAWGLVSKQKLMHSSQCSAASFTFWHRTTADSSSVHGAMESRDLYLLNSAWTFRWSRMKCWFEQNKYTFHLVFFLLKPPPNIWSCVPSWYLIMSPLFFVAGEWWCTIAYIWQ